MPETGETKTCPLCAEEVKASARVCPHCRHWLRKWSFLNPHVSVAVAVAIWVLVGVCFTAFINRVLGPKTDFAQYRDQIRVSNSQYSQGMHGSNLWNTVVGTLTNDSSVGWKDVEVEAQFFDKSGKMIDDIPVRDYGFGPVILPHGEAAFKIEDRAARPASAYATNKLYVRWAKDVHEMF